MNLAKVQTLLEKEIEHIPHQEMREAIERHRVKLRIENREWDYSKEYKTYPCCIVLEDPITNTAIAYCEEGFGPANPWGLLFIKGQHMNMGMDAAWFSCIEDAVRESMFWKGNNPRDYVVK